SRTDIVPGAAGVIFGKTYTISGWFKTPDRNALTVYWEIPHWIGGVYSGGLGRYFAASDFPANDEWVKISITFTIPANTSELDFRLDVFAGTLYTSSWKLEEGNKATDWTPNPDDYGAMAYEDIVELSKLGTTVIENGKIKTTLLDAEYIK